MSTSDESSRGTERNEPLDENRPTPDRLLHTGGDRPVDPEDLVRLTGREPTPERLEWARKKLEEEGPAAVERLLP
ncbi:hypothetical protein [Streptomyces alkaliphilus]|uniref:DUF2795 domain-containing protein n=1 Tax=Streptomyces alkaliphilus TaxID=1472722 RepID=A0A7W3TI13_9ACTN|nr:hypothetical protein [Streptomyces alkaliphilus]MBB0247189.1 hypothetical protein [Streptomyces alkaliphilus]MQS10284.1 hypothetical protein [Streptomyces alkaliphilus]